MAAREVRASPRRLLLLTASVAVGVAALVAINSFTANLRDSVRRQAQALLGADLSLASRQPLPPVAERLIDTLVDARRARRRGSPTSRRWRYVPRTDGTRLVQVAAIRGDYPFYGEIRTDPAAAWSELQRGRHVVVDPALLAALSARVGDTLALGEARFVISGTVASAPGNVGVRAAFGPRVFIPAQLPGGDRAARLRRPGGVRGLPAAAQRHRGPVDRQGARTDAPGRAGPGPHRGRRPRATQRDPVPSHRLSRPGRAGRAAARRDRGGERGGRLHPPADGHHRRAALPRRYRRAGARRLRRRGRGDGARGQPPRGAGRHAVPAGAARPARRPAAGGRADRGLLAARSRSAWAWGSGSRWCSRCFPLLAVRRVSPLAALRRDYERSRGRAIRGAGWSALALAASTVALARDPGRERPQGAIFAAGVAVALLVLWVASWALVRAARRWLPARAPVPVAPGPLQSPPARRTRRSRWCWPSASARFCSGTLILVQLNLLRSSDSPADRRRPNLVLFDIQPDQLAAGRAGSCARRDSRHRRRCRSCRCGSPR